MLCMGRGEGGGGFMCIVSILKHCYVTWRTIPCKWDYDFLAIYLTSVHVVETSSPLVVSVLLYEAIYFDCKCAQSLRARGDKKSY